jgi:uncharacterized repeat protein (TIGR01451 family)
VGTVAGAGGSGLAVFAVQMSNPILPGDPATLSNTASIADDGQNGADADTSDNSQTIEVPVVYTIFNKVEWQPTVASGYNLRYTIVVQNTGVTALNDVIITDTIPGATTFVEATAPVVSNIPPNLYGGWGSPGGAWNGNHTIVWNVGAVPAGSYASVKVHVHVLSGVAAGTIITNTAAMTGGGRGPAEAQVAATVIAPTIRPPTHTPTPTPTPTVSGLCPANPVLRVEVGSTTPYTDTAGYLWRSDQAYTAGVNDWGFTGGSDTFLTAAGIAGTLDDPLYQTERWWIGNGGYRFAVPNGLYNVTIKFAEVYPWAKPGNRVFTVTVEGSVVLGRLDVIRAAPGANTAYDKTFVATVNDGILNVDVIAERGSPALKAIALWKLEPCTGTVLPTPTSTPTPTATATPAPLCAPLRVDAGSGVPYSDSGGATWLADQTFASGSAVGGYAGASGVFSTGAAIANTTDPALYRTHRWFEGNGSYLFTVPNGRYDVTLKFAEIYPWTPVGGRVFNVVIEGNMALTHVDILATAGHNRAHDATFTVQVSDGMLNVEFLRERGNPAVNAILVTPLDCVAPTPRQ